MKKQLMLSLMLGGMLFLHGPPAQKAHASAPVPPAGKSVSISHEEAVILWDAKQKTQHLIRRFTFTSDAGVFGFLVPTPSQPQLSEVPNHLFVFLNRRVHPPIRWRQKAKYSFGSAILNLFSKNRTDKAGSSVRVLEQKSVAGYDAVVLAATDANAMSAWLKKHEFASNPALVEWLKPYIEKKWTITAFKVAKGKSQNPKIRANAVRMSFQTDRVIYPYREPTETSMRQGQPSAPRILRVHLLANDRMEGKLEEGKAWAGQVKYAHPVPRKWVEQLQIIPEVALKAIPGKIWLTSFEDRSSPRPKTSELIFTASNDTKPHLSPTVTRIREIPTTIPVELIAILLIPFFFMFRNRRSASPPSRRLNR